MSAKKIMLLQTKYGKYYSKELYEKYHNMSYRELQLECRMLRDTYNIQVKLSMSKSELMGVIRSFHTNKYDITHKKQVEEASPELCRMYDCVIENDKFIASEDIPYNGFIVCRNYKGVWYFLLQSEAPGTKYNVVETTLRKDNENGGLNCHRRVTAIRDIKKGEEIISAWKAFKPIKKNVLYDPKTYDKVLSDNDISSKSEWRQWLLINHPDRNPGLNMDLCKQIIAIGKERFRSKPQN